MEEKNSMTCMLNVRMGYPGGDVQEAFGDRSLKLRRKS